MPTETTPKPCRRISAPWEGLKGNAAWETFNWKERTWFVDARHGHLVMAEVVRDRESGDITSTCDGRYKPDRVVDFLSYDDVVAIYAICKETDCTFMEAVISYIGEKNLPEAWVQRALNAPEVRYQQAAKHQATITPKAEKKVFKDPRAVQEPEPVLEPLPKPGIKRPTAPVA